MGHSKYSTLYIPGLRDSLNTGSVTQPDLAPGWLWTLPVDLT